MAQIHHVKQARRAVPAAGIKVGQEYWWWSHRLGRTSLKRFSLTPPRPSQTTASPFLAEIYSAQETLSDRQREREQNYKWGQLTLQQIQELPEDLQEAYEAVEQQQEECQEKLDAQLEYFPNGNPSTETLEQRISDCSDLCLTLEDVKCSVEAVLERCCPPKSRRRKLRQDELHEVWSEIGRLFEQAEDAFSVF